MTRMSAITNLTPKQLRRAAAIKEKINALHHELVSVLGDTAPAATTKAPVAGRKRKFSAAGIAKIRAAQIARWAKLKGSGKPSLKQAAAKAPRRRSKMSAAAKAKLSARLKEIWAARKAAKAK